MKNRDLVDFMDERDIRTYPPILQLGLILKRAMLETGEPLVVVPAPVERIETPTMPKEQHARSMAFLNRITNNAKKRHAPDTRPETL